VLLHPHLNVYDFTAYELIDYNSGWDHLLLKRGVSCAERLFRETFQDFSGNPEAKKTYSIFLELKLKLDEHLRKEAYILFPYALKLLGKAVGAEAPESLSVGLLKNPLQVMQIEHTAMLELLGELRKGFHNFSLPIGDDRKKRMLYGELFLLEQTLYGHAHVQQNILFPKLMEAEQKIIKQWA
jgi:regulator of cell morphogenesis and NO signaling